jgi:hypothetical protein
MPNNSFTLQTCRLVLAFIWIYQGLVPKWLGPHPDELAMNMALGLSLAQAEVLSYAGGGMEVALGLLVLVFYRQRWPYLATVAGMLLLYVFTLVYAPQFLISAFNATTINLAMTALALIALSELSPRGLKNA